MKYNCNTIVKQDKKYAINLEGREIQEFEFIVYFLTFCIKNAIIKPS